MLTTLILKSLRLPQDDHIDLTCEKMAIILPTGQWYAPSAVIMMHGIAWYCMYGMVLRFITWYCMLLHGIEPSCTILHDLAPSCTILHHLEPS